MNYAVSPGIKKPEESGTDFLSILGGVAAGALTLATAGAAAPTLAIGTGTATGATAGIAAGAGLSGVGAGALTGGAIGATAGATPAILAAGGVGTGAGLGLSEALKRTKGLADDVMSGAQATKTLEGVAGINQPNKETGAIGGASVPNAGEIAGKYDQHSKYVEDAMNKLNEQNAMTRRAYQKPLQEAQDALKRMNGGM